MKIPDKELIGLALIGAEAKAVHLRNTKSDKEELKKIETEIIPELLRQVFNKEKKGKK